MFTLYYTRASSLPTGRAHPLALHPDEYRASLSPSSISLFEKILLQISDSPRDSNDDFSIRILSLGKRAAFIRFTLASCRSSILVWLLSLMARFLVSAPVTWPPWGVLSSLLRGSRTQPAFTVAHPGCPFSSGKVSFN